MKLSFEFLKRLLRRSQHGSRDKSPLALPANHSSHLEQLPAELLLLIVAFLPPECVVVLSLTSKFLFQFFFSAERQVLKNVLVKRQFLLLLEPDFRDYILCYACTKLYNWRTSREHKCPGRYHDSSHPCAASICSGMHSHLRLYREVRDLILRATRKGPEYGLPISYLAHDCVVVSRCYSTLGMPVSVKVRPKVVAGSLLCWRVEQIAVDISVDLTEQLYTLKGCVCDHTSYSTSIIARCALQHELDKKTYGTIKAPASGWKCHKLFQCEVCATDFRVHVTMASSNIMSIRMESWSDFGNGPDYGRAQDQFFGWSWQPHVDGLRPRNLQKSYREGTLDKASDTEAHGDENEQSLVAQDYSVTIWQEGGSLSDLPDF